jgi:hypothetical protein
LDRGTVLIELGDGSQKDNSLVAKKGRWTLSRHSNANTPRGKCSLGHQKIHNTVLHLTSVLLEKGIISHEEWEGATAGSHGLILKELQKLVVHPITEQDRRGIDDQHKPIINLLSDRRTN